MNDLGRKSNMQEDELREVKRLFDDERRKTATNEKALNQYVNDNRNLSGRLSNLQREVDKYKSEIGELEEKISKASNVITALEHDNDNLKSSITSLETQTERAENQGREIPRLRSQLNDLERLVDQKEEEIKRVAAQLKKKDNEVDSQARKARDLEKELGNTQSMLRETSENIREHESRPVSHRSEAGLGTAGFGGHSGAEGYPYSQQPLNRNQSVGGIATEEEKNHIIKVLEHESKVYRFEKNLANMMGGGDFDVYSEQGRSPHGRNNHSSDI
jgi:DNA repair exonuclease SbcCD ATPase subunit